MHFIIIPSFQRLVTSYKLSAHKAILSPKQAFWSSLTQHHLTA